MAAKTEFPLAPWSRSVWIITVAFVGLFLGLASFFCYRGVVGGSRPAIATINFVFSGMLIVLLLGMLIFAPHKYVLTPTSLVVFRLGPKVRIGFDQIESIELLVDRSLLGGVVRVMGVGGVFGYYGLFWGWKAGRFRAYITRTDRLVLIRRKQADPVLLSPRDPNAFVEQVKRQIGKDANHPETNEF
jgi:hypothetical protein